jgi:6-phospho-beta-glucosidase
LYYDPYLLGTYPSIFYEFIKKHNINFTISKKDLDYLKKYRVDLIGWNYYRPFYVSDYDYQLKQEQKPEELSITKQFKIVYPKQGVKYTP